jgi:phenylalanyl-tRNA synthetase beta chain
MDVDLVEEYARLNGYEHIPETLPAFGFAPKAHDQEFVTTQRVHQLAQAQGFQQAVNYAFVSSQWQSEFLGDRELMSKLGLDLAPEAIRILNPLNESLDVMRLSLLPALFQNMLHSYRYGSECGRVYESGSTFFRASDAYGESSRLSLIGWGHQTSPWKGNDVVPLVYELKGAVEQMLEGLNISSWRWQMLKAQEVPGFAHPEQCAVIFFEGKPAGFVGSLHPSVKEKYKLRHQCALGELDMNKILRGQPKKPIVSSIAKFPAVERDLAFLLPESVVAGDVAQEIRKAAGEVLKEISIFDVFSGEGLGDGMRSVGFRMKYQDLRGTLEEAQILGLQDKVIDSVCRKFSIRVR